MTKLVFVIISVRSYGRCMTIDEQTRPASTRSATPAPTRSMRRRRGRRRTLLTLRVIATAHTIAIFGQPVFAGSYLSGDYDMLALHATGADVVTTVALLQLLIAIVLWALGGPRWPTIGSVLLAIAETGQYFAGMAGALDLHIPLGVAILAAAVLITVTLWRPQLDEATGAGR